METRAATFSGCAVITHWLPHTRGQIFFRLISELKRVWCSLFSLSIQTGVFAYISCITLLQLGLSSNFEKELG